MAIEDVLWGGGKLVASSPEASSPVPPSQDTLQTFVDSARGAISKREGMNDVYKKVLLSDEFKNALDVLVKRQSSAE